MAASKRFSQRTIAERLQLTPGRAFHLRDTDANNTYGWERDRCEAATEQNLLRLSELQYKMYADARYAMLVVLQAIDGGGKDSTIRRVFSAFSPQGCTVTSFKVPSAEELRHDYLWRIHRHAPPRGEIAVFNRSHYEDVLVVRVNRLVPEPVWRARYEQINQFESLLHHSGTRVVKLFLQISKDEQKQRFVERLTDKRKQWKFDPADLDKRKQWGDYVAAYEACLTRCTTVHAPWYVVPADRKWFRDFAVSQILLRELEQLPLRWPVPDYEPAKIRVT